MALYIDYAWVSIVISSGMNPFITGPDAGDCTRSIFNGTRKAYTVPNRGPVTPWEARTSRTSAGGPRTCTRPCAADTTTSRSFSASKAYESFRSRAVDNLAFRPPREADQNIGTQTLVTSMATGLHVPTLSTTTLSYLGSQSRRFRFSLFLMTGFLRLGPMTTEVRAIEAAVTQPTLARLSSKRHR